MPQELALYPDLTARENLRFFAPAVRAAAAPSDAARVDEVLDVIGLADRADEQTKIYSGGMKRRLNIGLGLLHRPRLLVLDEPTVGVDPQSRNAILESVEQLGAPRAWPCSTRRTTWRRPSGSATGSGSSTSGELKAEGTRAELVALVGQHDRVQLGGDRRPRRARRRACARLAEVRAASVARRRRSS